MKEEKSRQTNFMHKKQHSADQGWEGSFNTGPCKNLGCQLIKREKSVRSELWQLNGSL